MVHGPPVGDRYSMTRLRCAARGLQMCHHTDPPRVLELPGASPEQPPPCNSAVLNGFSGYPGVESGQVLLTSLAAVQNYLWALKT